MKSFLAGLAMAVAAAIVFELRLEKDTGHSPRRHSGTADLPNPGQSGFSFAAERERDRNIPEQEPRRAAASPRAARSATPKADNRGRHAEEVLNSATRQQLLSVYGIGPVLADRIIQNRPYAAAYDVVEKGIIPESIYVQLRKQLLDQHSA